MRILVLSPFVPYPPEDGGRIRIFELLKGLAERHRIDLLALDDGTRPIEGSVEALRGAGFEVGVVPHAPARARTAVRAVAARRSFYTTLYRSGSFRRALEDRLAKGYDIVQCEYPYTGQYRLGLRGRYAARWVLDEHNLEYALALRLREVAPGARSGLYRAYASRELGLRRREEAEICKAMDRVIVVSEADRVELRKAVPETAVDVVPNGVDLGSYSPSGRPEARRVDGAVFVGKMDYRPNVDAVLWFCREVLPLVRRSAPGFTLTVVGPNPSREIRELAAGEDVRVTGRVPDTRPYLDEAAVAVIPLRAGSGTRLKVLEALATGRPIVSTTIGCEGIAVERGRSVLIADDAPSFATSILRLRASPAERLRLGKEGRRLVEARYGWRAAVAALERVYDELADRRPATGELVA